MTRAGQPMGVAMPPRRKRHLGPLWARGSAPAPALRDRIAQDALEGSLRSADEGTYTAIFRMTETGEKNPSPVSSKWLGNLEKRSFSDR